MTVQPHKIHECRIAGCEYIRKMKRFYLIALVVLSVAGCSKDPDIPDNTVEGPEKFSVVDVWTEFGHMYFWLYDETPIHKENFLKLASESFYDSTEFHRNVTNFVVQGGDPLSKDNDRSNDGTGGPGYTLEAEIMPDLKHKYSAIGAARLGDAQNPERRSNGSQFYICVNPDGSPHLDGAYTVFGEVISGMETAEEIEKQPKNSAGKPNDRIKMAMTVMHLTAEQIKSQFEFDVPLK